MGKNKRLPNDTVLAALQLVRGQDRRKAEYKEKVREIISRTGARPACACVHATCQGRHQQHHRRQG